MNVKICENIGKLRKENKMTQAQVAEYLGVSPQAVSKWEQGAAAPDIYLIPKIAFLFNISIDTLFGTSNMDKADLLVSKYSAIRNDVNYKEAKESLENILEMNDKSNKALGLLCHLEYQRALEFLFKSQKACEDLIAAAEGVDKEWNKRGKMQLMRINSMLGNYSFIEDYMKKFESSKSVDDFNCLLVALGERLDYEEIKRWGEDYIDSFTEEEQGMIYPNLMEAALNLQDEEYAKVCFDKIIEYNKDKHQIFNAWWLMWQLNKKLGNEEKIIECRDELLKQLPAQGCNEFRFEYLKNYLNGTGEKVENIM